MTGIRNYLVKHGEGELEDLIEQERSRLRQDEILNIDNIIERSLHICVLHPLKLHVYNLFVTEYTRLEPFDWCHTMYTSTPLKKLALKVILCCLRF